MTSFVATEGMFEEDFEDGSLEQEFLIEKDFYKLVLSKIFVYVCLIVLCVSSPNTMNYIWITLIVKH